MRARLAVALAVAAAVVPAAVALAGPPSRTADPRGDSASADPGNDLLGLSLRSAQQRGRPVLVVRLDTAGPLPRDRSFHEVSFRSGDCTFRLAYAREHRVAGRLTSPVLPAPVTYDCGPAAGTYAGLGATSTVLQGTTVGGVDGPTVKVGTTATSITWTAALVAGSVLPPGAVLQDVTGWASLSDDARQVYAPTVGGALSHDTVRRPTAFRVS